MVGWGRQRIPGRVLGLGGGEGRQAGCSQICVLSDLCPRASFSPLGKWVVVRIKGESVEGPRTLDFLTPGSLLVPPLQCPLVATDVFQRRLETLAPFLGRTGLHPICSGPSSLASALSQPPLPIFTEDTRTRPCLQPQHPCDCSAPLPTHPSPPLLQPLGLPSLPWP